VQIKLSYKIISPIVLFLVGAVLFFVLFSVRSLETAMIQSAFFRTNDQIHSRINQNITVLDVEHPYGPDSQGRFSLVVNEIADYSTMHVTVWNEDHIAIFSDIDAIIGTESTSPERIRQALGTPDGYYLKEGQTAKYAVWSAAGSVVRMFIPVIIESRRVVVEVEASSGVITQPIAGHIRNMVLVMSFGGLGIIAVLVLILRMFVLGPVQSLRTAFRIFSQGNLDYKVEHTQHDELNPVLLFLRLGKV
jgi:uncharacterized protein (UPF0333 family)